VLFSCVYTHAIREQWLSRIAQPGVRRRAKLFYQQLVKTRTPESVLVS
jgi:hypothetical protein